MLCHHVCLAASAGRCPGLEATVNWFAVMTVLGAAAWALDLQVTLSFYTVIICHWLPVIRDLHSKLAIIAAIFSQNCRRISYITSMLNSCP